MNRFDLIEKTYAATGKPMFAWIGFKANPDSAMSSSTSSDLMAQNAGRNAAFFIDRR